MASILGFRKALVFENVPADTEYIVDNYRGGYVYAEVTNDTQATVYFEVNGNPQGGHPGSKIPIKAGTTRAIPMALHTFKASGVVTVVAYGT